MDDKDINWYDYIIVYERLLEIRKMKIKKIKNKIKKNNG